MNEQSITELLLTQHPGATVVIKNPLGDGMHFHALVIDDAFGAHSLVERQRLVMAPLREAFRDDTIHALSLKTYTREEARAKEDVMRKFGLDPNDL